jgi:hypothetical protein
MAACFSDSLAHHMRVGLGYVSSIPDGRVTSNRQRLRALTACIAALTSNYSLSRECWLGSKRQTLASESIS